MSRLIALKETSSRADLAALLGYTPKSFAYVLYKIPEQAKYNNFEIPKKGGGTRLIKAPIAQLKTLQRRLAKLLSSCRAELDLAHKRPVLSHGFRKKYSIVTNARNHKGRRYVLNLDLADFFPSINFGRVRGLFIKHNDFKLNVDVATVIAQIACHDHSLPQGSPCSPIISDLATRFLDVRLMQLAKKHRCTYSRYADDITFSTNQKNFPSALASQAGSFEGPWSLSQQLVSKISDAGFSTNPKKTRMQCRTSRQVVTGLTVNVKANIGAVYYRRARAMSHSLFTTGAYRHAKAVIVAGSAPLTSEIIQKTETKLDVLDGTLNHIYYVKNLADYRDSVLKKSNPIAARKLYRRFLFFKHFVALQKPLIVCEGKTDNIYIRSAVKSLSGSYPKLISESTFQFNLFRYSSIADEVLRLGGGTGAFKILLPEYKKNIAAFKFSPLAHPVMLLIDNDAGAKSVFNVVKENFSVEVGLDTTEDFYHLHKNLYLIKTPELDPKGISYIESFFDKVWLEKEIDGKKFNLGKKHEAPGEFGKFWFAEKIVMPNAAQIDFSKFGRLLSRVVAVIEHYSQLNK